MAINNPQPEPQPPVAMEVNETYERLKIEIIELIHMLKITQSASEHLELALQINPSLQLLRQFNQQIEEQIQAQLQQELEDFQQNFLWNDIAVNEIAVPWDMEWAYYDYHQDINDEAAILIFGNGFSPPFS